MPSLRQLIRKRPQLAALFFGLTCALLLAVTGTLAGEYYLRWRDKNRQASLEVSVEDAPGTQPASKTSTPPASPRKVIIPETTGVTDAGDTGPELKKFYEDDPNFARKHRPNTRVTVTKRLDKDKKIVYQATYTTDACGRRIQPKPEGPPPEHAILFIGCSYTFGLCVNDDQTMPWQTALLMPDRAVYNYGVGSYGPQQMVELFKTDIEKQVPQKKALAIFSFHHEHINRAVGTPRVVKSFAQKFPWYEIDESTGRPVRKGLFSDRPEQPSNTGSKLVDAMRDYHGETLTKKDARLCALLLDEARVLFEKKFQSDGFYFLVYPGRQDALTDDVVNFLKERGAKILDYRHILGKPGDIDYDRWFVPGDGHPQPELHKKIAAKLAQDLASLQASH